MKYSPLCNSVLPLLVYMKEYRNKQNKQQPGQQGQSPLLVGQTQSPLGPPASSPIHPTSQSPMMSPSASPMMQHNSPLHSPAGLVSHSPGPGSVSSVLQSPGSNQQNTSMSPMQPSPRIGTPLSQSEGSPGPVQSPSQVCLPPPIPRMTSPQHRRVVTSPVGYTGDLRPNLTLAMGQVRFTRPSLEATSLQQRTRLQSPSPNFLQKPGTPSPLSSPPPQQITITQQQLLHRHLQQQALLQNNSEGQTQNENQQFSQRTMQLIQQRHLLRQQFTQQQQQAAVQPPPLTPQQHQLMIQQQQQLAKQQQQQIAAQLQTQANRLNQQNQQPNSPRPPQSPMVAQQIMSPHSIQSQPASPMPPRSPMVGYGNQPPNSPIARSPSVHGNQPPSSPMMHSQTMPNSPMPRSPMVVQSPLGMRRPPNSSPASDRPLESPNTSRSVYTPHMMSDMSLNDNDNTGGGNPHNPANPIPIPPGFGRFGYFKLGLRGGSPMYKLGLKGGSPMWGFGRGAKRPPSMVENKEEKIESGEMQKYKREPHLSKVSILKRKSPTKFNVPAIPNNRGNSLVSNEYNELDDSSSTPPVTPPPSTSRLTQKGKKLPMEQNDKESDGNVENKELHLMEYEDESDNNVVSTEVSLSSTAQTDGDDITVIQSFSQSDLGDVISSPLEADQMGDDFLLFPVDISDNTHYTDKEEEEQIDDEEEIGEELDITDKNMHIVNVAIQSPTTSEEELILQGKTKTVSTDGLTLNIMKGLSSSQLLTVTDTPESPEQEEMNVDPVDSPEEVHFESDNHGHQIVLINSSTKNSEEPISTKEDFEELIDESAKNENTIQADAKHINEIHKYAANSVINITPKSISTAGILQGTILTTNRSSNVVNLGQQISVVPLVQTNRKTNDVIITTQNQIRQNFANIILPGAKGANIQKLGNTALTIVSASSSQIASILPSRFTVPVISASMVSKLPNVKVIDKPSTSLSLTQETCLPKKIFEDDSVSPDSSNCEDDKSKQESSPEFSKQESPIETKLPEKVGNKVELNSNENGVNQLHFNKSNLKNEGVIKEEQKENTTEKNNEKTISNKTENKEIKNENLSLKNLPVKEQKNASPIRKGSSPLIIQNTPELKMTAQVIQEPGVQLQRTMESMSASFITTQALDTDNGSDLDTKSVVISIPSPTPSQEQMLDNIAMQALGNRRRDGKNISGEFESFEDVLDMIENITAEPPIEENIGEKVKKDSSGQNQENNQIKTNLQKSLSNNQSNLQSKTSNKHSNNNIQNHKIQANLQSSSNQTELQKNNALSENQSKVQNRIQTKVDAQVPVTVSTSNRLTTMPQLSPLSQPADLTTNMANVSQQLRTLLSSLNTSTVTSVSNVETIVKSSNFKDKIIPNVSVVTANAIVTSRNMQQNLTTTSNSTVIVPNLKQKNSGSSNDSNTVTSTTISTTSNSTSSTSSGISITSNGVTISSSGIFLNSSVSSSGLIINSTGMSLNTTSISRASPKLSQAEGTSNISSTSILTNRTIGGIQLMPDHPKLPPVTTISGSVSVSNAGSTQTNSVKQSTGAIISQSSGNTQQTKKPSLTLNAMLQSHPAATMPQTSPSTITTASILGSPISIAKSNFNPSLVQAQPHVVSPVTCNASLLSSAISSGKTTHVSTTNFLHNQLTKSIIRTKSTDEVSNEIKKEESKSEETSGCDSIITAASLLKQEPSTCKFSSVQSSTRMEDSQNVLLKQLLQNTACASTASQPTIPVSSCTQTAPSLPIVPNLEAQLARPVPPTPTSLLPPILQNDSNSVKVNKSPTVTRETSFVSKPLQQSPVATSSTQQLHIDIKKCLPPSRTPSRDDLLSPPTPRSTGSQDSSLQTSPLPIKKEIPQPQQSPLLSSNEVKKEFFDETSQHSEISDHGRGDIQMKEELVENLDVSNDKMLMDKEEMKKIKRRAYQQKRRQNLLMNKEAAGQPKKRARKSSKLEEDYDSFIESLLVQLRALPPLIVSEPMLNKNFGIQPVFGSGDLTKLSNKDFDPRYGDLIGNYGDAIVPGYTDYYNTKPYGDIDPKPEKPPASTQRGFYDQEFPLIKFDTNENKKFTLFARDDSPDSIISSSSPEAVIKQEVNTGGRFVGLRLISDDEEEEDDVVKQRASPVVPILKPIPIRLKASGPYLKDCADMVSFYFLLLLLFYNFFWISLIFVLN